MKREKAGDGFESFAYTFLPQDSGRRVLACSDLGIAHSDDRAFLLGCIEYELERSRAWSGERHDSF